ncbi:type VI secretion system lipoprotein TssJ [Winslowiella iniecta]|uniref:Type VI secretion lipoprotein/VasD n=1 Tax=Winslowiella iniecta TaxID=1560201 RepID=A0A0L7SYD2_9GAMM|nr:type VI secretion system lipoprotein TssJ [Winslowiella iniecta]KOC88075.1 Type VI secretion lipoprotein/VasD [Winslowiella iniecta]KOC89658.1 Type VI secretion lipoprotein/VasD [Winslowiella iniecta]
MNGFNGLRLSAQALLLAVLPLVSGCFSSSNSSQQVRYSLSFQAHPQINESAPLKVRVLLLKSDADFMAADFWSLQNDAHALLGANLLNSEQFFLRPGQLNKKISGQGSGEARYLGILAEYQSLDGKIWRLSLPLSAPGEGLLHSIWQGSSGETDAEVIADINGIRVIR